MLESINQLFNNQIWWGWEASIKHWGCFMYTMSCKTPYKKAFDSYNCRISQLWITKTVRNMWRVKNLAIELNVLKQLTPNSCLLLWATSRALCLPTEPSKSILVLNTYLWPKMIWFLGLGTNSQVCWLSEAWNSSFLVEN